MSQTSLNVEANTLSANLTGKVIHIPDLKVAFPSWPAGTNQSLEQLRPEVDKMLKKTIDDSKKLNGNKKCNWTWLISCCFPKSPWTELQAVAAMLVWIFNWDDEIDEGDDEVATNEQSARLFCQRSLEYSRWALGLDSPTGVRDETREPSCNIPVMSLFGDLTRDICKKTDIHQRTRIYNEMETYMNYTVIEQTSRNAGQIPTPEQYFQLRLGTSGIRPVIAMADYAVKVRLPKWIMASDSMEVIWRETTVLCMLINDVYSLKKEMVSGSVLNMIPILFNASNTNNVNDAMAEVLEIMRESAGRFDEAATDLQIMAKEAGYDVEAKAYVNVCRTTVTGLNNWALMTKRYNLAAYPLKDDCFVVTL